MSEGSRRLNAEARGGPPLLVFSDDWGRHPSSCQHLVRHLLDRREVWWVDTIGMRPPRLDRETVARVLEKARAWARRSRAPIASEAINPRVLSPRMWPWFRSGFDRRLNRTLLLRQVGGALRSSAEPPVVVTTIPIVADLIGRLPAARWVYYCVDDFGQWPGLDQAAMARLEADLVARVDTVVTASEVLQDRLARMGRDSALLTHGVDLAHWTRIDPGPAIPALDGLARPLVVFWGVIDRRLDIRALECLSSRLDEGTILLVGPGQDPDPRLATLDRVVRIAPVTYDQLPRLAREASVLIMPYADLPVTRAMQPLKLKEYLAAGRPAIVSDLPATCPWADCLDLANAPETFAAAVLKRIETGLPEAQRAARGRIASESWAAKAREFEALALTAEDGAPTAMTTAKSRPEKREA